MNSFLPIGGFQLPFQRRLSRLYNDTKKSTDFVKEPVQNEDDPEIKALHRKLRIQKDRLVTWGLEWSDPNQSAEIDESLSKAGLSEVVGSIMSTIKDILAEAEPLWQSSKRVVEGPRPSPDRKPPLVQWDRSRFQDLIRDLTASIDTLYDLSRTRSSGLMTRRFSKTNYKSVSGTEDSKPFESSRVQTPQQIDPQLLTHLQPANDRLSHCSREIVLMSKSAYLELGQSATREPWAPLLLEHAPFDPIYSTTGIMPEMARFEKLAAGLQQDPQRAPGTWTGLPRLLGYYEDMENSRLGLVYRLPSTFNVLSSEKPSETSHYNLPTLHHLLSESQSEPPLEAKFRLAFNLTNTVFDLHARGVTHGSLTDKNISFCNVPAEDKTTADHATDIRRPLVSSFDLFPEDDSSTSPSPWRHPLDPRIGRGTTLSRSTDERIFELYSLSLILLSIGLWTKVESLALELTSVDAFEPLLDRLAVKCGSLYAKAAQKCWQAVDEEKSGQVGGESLLSAVQVSVSRYLEACCILDGVSGLEGRIAEDVQGPRTEEQSTRDQAKEMRGASTTSLGDKKESSAAFKSRNEVMQPREQADVDDRGCETAPDVDRSETRMRLYPHVPLAPEMVDKWNSIVMPQVNQALRHFYRKHPESVEISLESVGPSPNKTRPTVLVICTSVGKVRAILKKRLGDLFDGNAGFGLKVCKGQVLRSRRQGKATTAPQNRDVPPPESTDDGEAEPMNPKYQPQPNNGASIGAWIGDRHLPPASFGGLVLIDNKPYGMTVHHMLDDPDESQDLSNIARSSAAHDTSSHLRTDDSDDVQDDDESSYGLSDVESELYSDTDITSDYDEEDESDQEFDDGDIPGIEPGCGDEYIITQPAFDDVEEGFYPCPDTEDEDHLDTYSLGEVFASSGIRRKQVNGLLHEVDWALFRFSDGRIPDENCIPSVLGGPSDRALSKTPEGVAQLRPTSVAPSSALPGMEVQCVARTSGVQLGQILPSLTIVKMSGRTSPSHTYQVTSAPSSGHNMGIPGDSGAWVVDRHHGQLCGHVLAWSERKRVAYICPMDVLLLDLAQTLDASERLAKPVLKDATIFTMPPP
ncbi:hypothetical protein HIM_04144 [Hirsutella minnesotensis 3608]|uniref:Prion-inhibition and propagation HeLo domain-containing protein n=1 Tax=Hirsutella minnesotensis 3608 TaxID=1043627 RepID=A0A0F7ZQ06_9HYPO|nr:hypothetical protein HIM_04144 [Hirsutella minnesotensis 3608]